MEISWTSHGMPWKSHVNPMEIPWKSHGNPMESTWNPTEILWKSHRNSMESQGNPMEIPWKSHGNPMESYGNPMEILANPSGAKAAQPRFKRKFLPRQIWPRKGSVHKCAPCTLVYRPLSGPNLARKKFLFESGLSSFRAGRMRKDFHGISMGFP